MDPLADFKRRIDDFLERTGMAPSSFGQAACSDPSFVADVKDGREPRQSTIRKVDAFMKTYRIPGAHLNPRASSAQRRSA